MRISLNFLATVLGICTIILFSQNLSAQKKGKNSKVTIEDLQNMTCPIDSNAEAYYIFEKGNVRFKYRDSHVTDHSESRGFQILIDVHYRIKFLKSTAFNYADISIPFYCESFNKEEKIKNLSAVTYNLENNKIVKTSLDKKSIITENTFGNYLKSLKFAMPKVKEGSIIDIRYTIVSDFITRVPGIKFQQAIPILCSDHTVEFPEYFVYIQDMQGYIPIDVETKKKQNSIMLTYTRLKTNPYSNESSSETVKIDYAETMYHYYAENIPAFDQEVFLRSENNYIAKVTFELSAVTMPYSTPHLYSSTWNKMNENLWKNEDFGERMRTKSLDECTAKIKSSNLEGIPLMDSAFNFIRNNFTWNTITSVFAKQSLKKAIEEKKGNNAEINMSLITILNNLGFDAYPVLVSTQKNGYPIQTQANLFSFNYLIAMVNYDNKTYLMDASDPYALVDLLPIRSINGKGRIIDAKNGSWIDLETKKAYISNHTHVIALDDSLNIKMISNAKYFEYGAFNIRSHITYGSQDYSKLKEMQANPNTTIESYELKHVADLNDSLEEYIIKTYKNSSQQTADIVFFSAVLNPDFSTNPFTTPTREYPVEFNYPFHTHQKYVFTIPENYELESFPNTTVLNTPDNAIVYRFTSSIENNLLTITTNLDIEHSIFLPTEYQNLRKMFIDMHELENEKIVLRKIK